MYQIIICEDDPAQNAYIKKASSKLIYLYPYTCILTCIQKKFLNRTLIRPFLPSF